jgi:hypothetical protein
MFHLASFREKLPERRSVIKIPFIIIMRDVTDALIISGFKDSTSVAYINLVAA